MDDYSLIGRTEALFTSDLLKHRDILTATVSKSSFLVIGGAGSIGQEVTREIFERNPRVLHVVDINENNLVELVRNLRSTIGYCDGDFRTFAIDCGGPEFTALVDNAGPYDYFLNLSALKHVRNEKDPFTLMRMIKVNIFNTLKMVELARNGHAKNYFCVSTDKAANPVNLMGASKRIMEMFLIRESLSQNVSSARFANVAFSDGSLLHSFKVRFLKGQPFSAPKRIQRYFITAKESGELCLLSALMGENRDIFFPKLSDKLHLITFPEIATKYLNQHGYQPYDCATEEEARTRAKELISRKYWPCYFFDSDTTGEKDFEEFYTDAEDIDMSRFDSIGVIRNEAIFDSDKLDSFNWAIESLQSQPTWMKADIVELFLELLPNFEHKETGKYLDERM